MAIVKSFKADVSTIRIRSDEGLTLEPSALKLFKMANLRYQLSSDVFYDLLLNRPAATWSLFV